MAKVTLNPLAKWELAWWLNNLELSNDRSIIQSLLKILLQANASKKRWGEMFKGMKTGDLWSKKEQECYIKFLKLLSINLALTTFKKILKFKLVHIQVDNLTALSYLLKMGETKNQ